MVQNGPSSSKKRIARRDLEEKVEEEILSMVEEGHEQGVILEDEVEMISNIFEFGDKIARDIMTSRQKIVAISKDFSLEQALYFALENRFSRYPVYEEDIDNIIGMLHLKDLVSAYLENQEKNLIDIIEDPIFIHPTINISKLLKRMQREKIHIALVVDEYGQTEGIVAMEDIIEEIFGDIKDEHDEDEVCMIKKVSDDTFIVDGMTYLEELEVLLQINFPDENIETINGFMLYVLGRLPSEDSITEIKYMGYSFASMSVVDNMITKIEIKKINEEIDIDVNNQ